MNKKELLKKIEKDEYSHLEFGGSRINPENVFNMILNAEKYKKKILVFTNFWFEPKDWIEKYKKVKK